jgi:hypothetical protein
MPATPEGGRDMLLNLVAEAVTRIHTLLAAHDERNAFEAAGRLDHLAFDDSDDGERLRRYQLAHGRIFLRTVTTLFKVRRELENHDDAEECETDGNPAILEPPVGWSGEIHTVQPELHVPPAVAPILPAEAEPETPTPAPPESSIPAPSSTVDSDPRKPALQADDASDAPESRLQVESIDTQNDETKPMPVEAHSMPALDPCSEGRHIEPVIDSPVPIPVVTRSRTPARTAALRRTGSNSLPPTMIRLLTELVMRQVITGGPDPLPGQGRFRRLQSP